jgi:hypothetical protein
VFGYLETGNVFKEQAVKVSQGNGAVYWQTYGGIAYCILVSNFVSFV